MGKLATTMLLLGGGLAGLSLAGAAGATPLTDPPALVVRYSEASLTTDSGVRGLYRRLAVAAEQVCPNSPSNAHIINEKILQCRQEALAAAVTKIHNQRLAALHAANRKSV